MNGNERVEQKSYSFVERVNVFGPTAGEMSWLFFLFHLFFVKRGPAARKTTRKRNEKRAARPSEATKPNKLIFSLVWAAKKGLICGLWGGAHLPRSHSLHQKLSLLIPLNLLASFAFIPAIS